MLCGCTCTPNATNLHAEHACVCCVYAGASLVLLVCAAARATACGCSGLVPKQQWHTCTQQPYLDSRHVVPRCNQRHGACVWSKPLLQPQGAISSNTQTPQPPPILSTVSRRPDTTQHKHGCLAAPYKVVGCRLHATSFNNEGNNTKRTAGGGTAELVAHHRHHAL